MVVYHDRNLIINYIPRNLSDVDLSNLFSSVGAIKTCRIIRDHNDGSSFGFGFCEYENAESAHRAIERFNGYRIADKVLKVSLAKLQGRLYQSSNLYVKNFPTSVTDEQILSEFSRFGKVQQCRVLRDRETNASKGSAYVLYENRGDAETARKSLDGTFWPGSSEDQLLSIKFATPPYRQPSCTTSVSKSNSSSPSGTSAELSYDDQLAAQLLALQSRTGYVYDPSLNSQGTPFIPEAVYVSPGQAVQGSFPLQSSPPLVSWPSELSESLSMANASIHLPSAYVSPVIVAQHPSVSGFWPSTQPFISPQSLNVLYTNQIDGITNAVHGCPIFTGFSTPLFPSNGHHSSSSLRGLLGGLLQDDPVSKKSKSCKVDRSGNASVYVYNIGNLMTERRLCDLFSRFGIVLGVSIPRDPKTNYARNFGFVTFNTVQSARNAITSMNGFMYDGRRLQVSLRKPRTGSAKNNGDCVSKDHVPAIDAEGILSECDRPENSIDSATESLKNEQISPTESCVDSLASLRLGDPISKSNSFNDSLPSAIKT